MSNPLDLESGAAAALANLPRKTWTIPESARNGTTDPKTITLRHLTYSEEKAAMEAKEKGGHITYVECAKRALCAADEKPLSWTGDEVERFFEALSTNVRELVVRAYLSFCMPSDEETKSFLASGKVTI